MKLKEHKGCTQFPSLRTSNHFHNGGLHNHKKGKKEINFIIHDMEAGNLVKRWRGAFFENQKGGLPARLFFFELSAYLKLDSKRHVVL